jgi:hypothetical protein
MMASISGRRPFLLLLAAVMLSAVMTPQVSATGRHLLQSAGKYTH